MASPVSEILPHFCLPSKQLNFAFRLWTMIVHGGQKIELAQNIHASEMHANQFWWAWLLWFRRL